ncbi:MAG: hypothetical protein HY655_05005 [Acidobacteria bacterium]|nr:hypothetical protein [Acidobacteriota bacterium]
MIRQLAGRAFSRLLTAAGLARAADVERERRAREHLLDTERARASRDAAATAARLKELRDKVDTWHERFAAEHRQCNSLVGLLRYYVVRLRRAEAELAARASSERQLKLAQLAIAVKTARRLGVPPAAAERVGHFASISDDYAAAVSRWRAGDLPADVRRVTLARLHWSIPADTADASSRRLLKSTELPFDDFASVRRFAVGGIMLDIGANVGAASIPRIVLGDFSHAYAAEPDEGHYLCLVGNTLENRLEGRLLPERVVIAGSSGTVRLRDPEGQECEGMPSLTLDAWVQRLGIAAADVRFVRIAIQDWNLDVLHGAANLLKRRQIVWQIEIQHALLRAGDGRLEDLADRIAAYFTHVKELGRYWTSQWRPASDAGAILHTLSGEHRPANLLLFNMPSGSTRKRPSAVAISPSVRTREPSNGALISLLHSTARLPDGWRPAMEAFLGRAADPKNVEYILAVDEGLDFSLPAEAVAGWARAVLVQQGVTGPNSGYNAAAKVAGGDILMTIADDYFPPDGWDDEIRRAIPDLSEEVVLDVDNSDGSAWLLPFSILTRKYYDRYGYILYPGYHGLCSDNEFTIQARRDGVVRPARHIVFEHRHPDRGLAPMDEIYARQKAHYKEAQELFRRRQAKGFPKWPD